MRLLSFDQSSVSTGWVVFDNDKYIEHGLINLTKIKDKDQKFKVMTDEIRQKIIAEDPDLVLLEGVMLMRSPAVMEMLAKLQGIIIGYCQVLSIPYEIYHPATWRSVLKFQTKGQKRADLKQQAIDRVAEAFGLTVQTDEADAICIAMAHILKSGGKIDGNEN